MVPRDLNIGVSPGFGGLMNRAKYLQPLTNWNDPPSRAPISRFFSPQANPVIYKDIKNGAPNLTLLITCSARGPPCRSNKNGPKIRHFGCPVGS